MKLSMIRKKLNYNFNRDTSFYPYLGIGYYKSEELEKSCLCSRNLINEIVDESEWLNFKYKFDQEYDRGPNE